MPLDKTLSTPTNLEKTALLFCVGLSVFAFLFPELLTEHLQPTINKILGSNTYIFLQSYNKKRIQFR
ncbi:hypothetical protein D172_009645 [Pseudoalteromonas sp. Bsw20308]|nr:hypothetical protein D172_009645 [Pseudoalteromonas sp. Bsw20308]